MLDEHVPLFEAFRIKQQLDALACGQLALGVLGVDALRSAAEPRGLAHLLEPSNDFLHGCPWSLGSVPGPGSCAGGGPRAPLGGHRGRQRSGGDGGDRARQPGRDFRVAPEIRTESLVDHLPHPVLGLAAATGDELAARLHRAAVALHFAPEARDAIPVQRRQREHRWPPVRRGWPQDRKRVLQHALRLCGALRVEVALVDDDDVGELDDALLQCLPLVAGIRQLQQHHQVGHARDRGLRLSHADRLDDDHIEPGRFADGQRFARSRGDAAERRAGGRGADECVRRPRQLLHPCLVGEDRAAGHAARRVHRKHRDAMAARDQMQAERFDEGRLAHAGRAADADADRSHRVR